MRLPDSWKKARLTIAIMAATAAAWVFIGLSGVDLAALVHGGFVPARVGAAGDGFLIPVWLTPLTATLLHAGLVHLAFNLLILALCGRPVESAVGPFGLAALYLLGAYAAAAAQYALDPASLVTVSGAGGAISAVVGAYAMLFGRNQRVGRWLNALWLLAAWVVINLLVGFGYGAAFAGMAAAVASLLGGFLVGILLANPLLLFRYRRA